MVGARARNATTRADVGRCSTRAGATRYAGGPRSSGRGPVRMPAGSQGAGLRPLVAGIIGAGCWCAGAGVFGRSSAMPHTATDRYQSALAD